MGLVAAVVAALIIFALSFSSALGVGLIIMSTLSNVDEIAGDGCAPPSRSGVVLLGTAGVIFSFCFDIEFGSFL